MITTTDFRLVAFLKSRGIEPLRDVVTVSNQQRQVEWTLPDTEEVRDLREIFISQGFALYYDYAQKLKGEIWKKVR